MGSVHEHNSALQQVNAFTAVDLEANKKGEYSPAQLERFKAERDYIQYSSKKYENKGPVISLIFGLGLVVFVAVLYFVGAFDMLQTMLGGLFLPVMAGLALLAILFVFVIAPRSYKSSVDMYKSMGTPLKEQPLGAVQVIEARAEAYRSQGASTAAGINHRRLHLSCKWTVSNSISRSP